MTLMRRTIPSAKELGLLAASAASVEISVIQRINISLQPSATMITSIQTELPNSQSTSTCYVCLICPDLSSRIVPTVSITAI